MLLDKKSSINVRLNRVQKAARDILLDVAEIRDELQDSLLFLSSTENIQESSLSSINVLHRQDDGSASSVCPEDDGSASSSYQCDHIAANDRLQETATVSDSDAVEEFLLLIGFFSKKLAKKY